MKVTLPANETRGAYDAMMRRLYLLSLVEEGSAEIDVEECVRASEEGWADDAGGQPYLDAAGFKRCFFQLADLHTESVRRVGFDSPACMPMCHSYT